MTPDEQIATDRLKAAISAKFPDIFPTVVEGGAGVALALGCGAARMAEVESAMQNETMETMLETGVLVILSP